MLPMVLVWCWRKKVNSILQKNFFHRFKKLQVEKGQFDIAKELFTQVSSPTLIIERAGSNAWTHKSWRVREEFAKTITSDIGLFASTALPLQHITDVIRP